MRDRARPENDVQVVDMDSGTIFAAMMTAVGISVAALVGRQLTLGLVRALLERCRRRTITETAAALAGGGVVIQSTAEGDTFLIARPVVPPPADRPPTERILPPPGPDVCVVVGDMIPGDLAHTMAAEAGR